MLVYNIILSIVAFVNTNCICYEGTNDMGDIYIIYVKGSNTCELVHLSHFMVTIHPSVMSLHVIWRIVQCFKILKYPIVPWY